MTGCVLVADNDEGVVSAIRTRLESAGYQCVTAQSGAQALSQFRAGGIDLVVSDLNMPAGDGVSLARSIREHSDVPIILVTGFRDEFRRLLRTVRNVTVLEKPFDARQLVDLVEVSLSMSEPGAGSEKGGAG